MGPDTEPNALELTVAGAWLLAELLGAGALPWALAITPPCADPAQADRLRAEQTAELRRMGVLTADGRVKPVVAQWIRTVCRAERWLELRFVAGAGDMLRGVVARRADRTVVALRNAQLVTFTAMTVDHPHALVPVVTAGLAGRPPAVFDRFVLPARAGARADERIRAGAPVAEVLEFLGVPASARPVVEAAFDPRRRYVEIVAGEHRDGHRRTTEVGVGVVDTPAGRVLVSPARAFDGEWVSTFRPGTPDAIAAAVDALAAELPGGGWFQPAAGPRDAARNFDERTETHCPTTL